MLAGLIFLIRTECSSGAEAAVEHLSRSVSADTKALMDHLASRYPNAIERDARGNIVSVQFGSYDFLNDKNLWLLSSLPELKSVTLSYHAKTKQPTATGIAFLQRAPQLKWLTLSCSPEMPTSVLGGVASLTQLQRLSLLEAFAVDPNAYLCLTNLTALKRLDVWSLRVLKPAWFQPLRALRQLREVHIHYNEDPDDESLQAILSLSNLTNIVIETRKSVVTQTRQPKQ